MGLTIRDYADPELKALLVDGASPSNRNKYPTDCIKPLQRVAQRILAANDFESLKRIKGLAVHPLQDNWKGYYAISVTKAGRLIVRHDGSKNELFAVDFRKGLSRQEEDKEVNLAIQFHPGEILKEDYLDLYKPRYPLSLLHVLAFPLLKSIQ